MYRLITLPISRAVLRFVRLLTVLTVATTSTPAVAQKRYPGGIFPLYYVDLMPSEFVATALAQPYGQLLASEFAAVIGESADLTCLQARQVSKSQLQERARAILQQRGTHLLATYIATIDRTAFERHLLERLGRDGVVKLAYLKGDSKVQAYVAAEEPARYANLLNLIAESLGRFVLIKRINLTRSISPYDNRAIEQADPTEATKAKLVALVANDRTGDLKRYLSTLQAAQAPLDDSVDLDKLKSYGPLQLLDGIEGDLAELCIPGTKEP